MQTVDNLRRVARECVEDLAEDGVVYAEVRYAPSSTSRAGWRSTDVVEAVRDGFARGRGAGPPRRQPHRRTPGC